MRDLETINQVSDNESTCSSEDKSSLTFLTNEKY
jgi:hypothetical protein